MCIIKYCVVCRHNITLCQAVEVANELYSRIRDNKHITSEQVNSLNDKIYFFSCICALWT